MIAVNGLEDGSISVSRFLRLLYLLPSLTCFLPPCLWFCLPHPLPFFPGFIMATHQQSAPLSPNGAAISTNAFPTYSSCHITIWMKAHVYLRSPQSPSCLSSNPISCLGPNALHFMSTPLHLRDSSHHQKLYDGRKEADDIVTAVILLITV